MTETSNSQLSARSVALRDELQLTSWPLRDERSAWLIVTAELMAAGGIALLTGSVAMALGSLLVLMLASWRLWTPVRFYFGPRGVAQAVLGRQRRTGWHLIQSYQVRERGVLLLPVAGAGPLAAFRGLYVPYNGHRDEMLAIVQRYSTRRSPSSHGSTIPL